MRKLKESTWAEGRHRMPISRFWRRSWKVDWGSTTPCNSTTAHSKHLASPQLHFNLICIFLRLPIFDSSALREGKTKKLEALMTEDGGKLEISSRSLGKKMIYLVLILELRTASFSFDIFHDPLFQRWNTCQYHILI